MTTDAYAVLLISLSGIAVVGWLSAIWFVGLKLAASNGSFRLLALILALTVIMSMMSVGLLFNSQTYRFSDSGAVSYDYVLGAAFVRFMSIIGAGTVLFFGRPRTIETSKEAEMLTHELAAVRQDLIQSGRDLRIALDRIDMLKDQALARAQEREYVQPPEPVAGEGEAILPRQVVAIEPHNVEVQNQEGGDNAGQGRQEEPQETETTKET